MSFVYVVVENSDSEPPAGGVYPVAFTSFYKAKEAALKPYLEDLNREREEAMGERMASEVDVPENPSGPTQLYIEKGINIYIHKLPVMVSGGKRSSRKNRRNFSRKNRIN